MVTIAQSAANWCNTHTHVDHTHSLTHLHQHSYNDVVQSTSSAITEFGIKFYFEGTRVRCIHCVLSILQLCSKHHFGIRKQERMGGSDNQAVLLQKTWKSIKNVAENVTSKSKVSRSVSTPC